MEVPNEIVLKDLYELNESPALVYISALMHAYAIRPENHGYS